MGKSDNKSRVLGDDPLAWLNADVNKKASKKKLSPKKKKVQKVKTEKVKAEKVKAEKKSKKTKSEVDTGDSINRLVLESSLIINNANDVYEALKKLEGAGQEIEIDASKIENIDSAILQLLYAFVLKIKASDMKLSWYKPTEVLLNKASTLGLLKQLGL